MDIGFLVRLGIGIMIGTSDAVPDLCFYGQADEACPRGIPEVPSLCHVA
jgi:hypothetical protein